MKQNQKQMKRDRDFNLRLSEPEYIYLKKNVQREQSFGLKMGG